MVIVGDRTPPAQSGSARVAHVDFLGAPAPFAQGPFILASLLDCPVYLCFCLRQGQGYRIIFVHVPSSQMSMFIYIVMAAWAGVGLAFNTRLSGMMAAALAPTGALFAFLSLLTGSLWGKPMWGTWWVWDARLTSTLILLFFYLGFLALQSSIDDPRRADKACAVLALVGVVNVPIIYFSVNWWNTLHQGASVSLTRAPSMATPMLWGMLIMVLAFWMYAIAAALARVRNIILERERHTDWVKNAVE